MVGWKPENGSHYYCWRDLKNRWFHIFRRIAKLVSGFGVVPFVAVSDLTGFLASMIAHCLCGGNELEQKTHSYQLLNIGIKRCNRLRTNWRNERIRKVDSSLFCSAPSPCSYLQFTSFYITHKNLVPIVKSLREHSYQAMIYIRRECASDIKAIYTLNDAFYIPNYCTWNYW